MLSDSVKAKPQAMTSAMAVKSSPRHCRWNLGRWQASCWRGSLRIGDARPGMVIVADAGQRMARERLTRPCCKATLHRQANALWFTSVIWERPIEKGALHEPVIQSINIPFFINNDSLSQMVMSAFEVLPKETFGLLFGTIKPSKIFISSIQPSQEVVSREETSVQPDRDAIDRLETLRSRLSTTNLIGSYHSHVYLSKEGIESIEEGASPSSQDAENLLSSQWRQILVIVGYFSSESWGIPRVGHPNNNNVLRLTRRRGRVGQPSF